jgi:hypothetical protein
MNSFTRQRLDQDAGWRLVLDAYLHAAGPAAPRAVVVAPAVEPDELDDADDAAAEAETDDASAGWVPRIDEIVGVAAEHLARLHGRLIAFGLLKFQLTSATTGVVYRVTPKGRTLLEEAAEAPHAIDAETERVAA